MGGETGVLGRRLVSRRLTLAKGLLDMADGQQGIPARPQGGQQHDQDQHRTGHVAVPGRGEQRDPGQDGESGQQEGGVAQAGTLVPFRKHGCVPADFPVPGIRPAGTPGIFHLAGDITDAPGRTGVQEQVAVADGGRQVFRPEIGDMPGLAEYIHLCLDPPDGIAETRRTGEQCGSGVHHQYFFMKGSHLPGVAFLQKYNTFR